MKKLISIIGPESAKRIIVNVMDEAYKENVNSVDLLEEKISDYIGNESKNGMLGIFSEMTENPKEHSKKKPNTG